MFLKRNDLLPAKLHLFIFFQLFYLIYYVYFVCIHFNLQSEIDRLRETIDSTFADLPQSDDISLEQMQQPVIDPLAPDTIVKPAIATSSYADNSGCNTIELIDDKELERIKDRQRRKKRKKFIGYVRSRKIKRKLKIANAARAAQLALAKTTESNKKCINPLSIDAINGNIPKLELPYKKFRNAMFEIISQNEILEKRTRVHRRASQPFDYKRATAQAPGAAFPKQTRKTFDNGATQPPPANNNNINKARISSSGFDSDDHQMASTCGSRNKRRINYSEELVDEAFMYEQILHDKQHHKQQKRKQSHTKTLQSKSLDGVLDAAVNSAAADAASGSGGLDSRLRLLEQRNEISIMPVRSRLMAKENPIDAQHMPIPIKTEPLFNITSSVSVHIKSRPDQPTQNIQISNITSLHDEPRATTSAAFSSSVPSSLALSKKRRKVSCDHCQKIFSNAKHLAKHQLEHVKISAYKIDTVRILNPKLRRVSTIHN